MEGYDIPHPRNAEDAQIQLSAVQIAIEGINDRILLLQLQRERYEQQGHRLVELMVSSTVGGA